MSAKRTVTVLRSPSIVSGSSASRTLRGNFAGPGLLAPNASGVVHWPQNLNSGGFSERHLGQMRASAAVHCPQNLIPPGFSKPHFEQRITVSRFGRRVRFQISSFQGP